MSSGAPACPTCGREDFKNERGMKQHHARIHGESLNTTTRQCGVCEGDYRVRKDKDSVACSVECLAEWRSEKLSGPEIQDEELLSELRRLADTTGRPPTKEMMGRRGGYGHGTYQKRFGSWNDALRAAGLQPNRENNPTKEKLADDLRQLAGEIGRPPLAVDIEDEGRHAPKTYIDVFGSLQKAREGGGLPARPEGYRKRVSDEELISEIERLAGELGHPPSQGDMSGRGCYSSGVYFNRFGSWTEALDATGFDSRFPLTGQDSPTWRGGKSIYDAVKLNLSNWQKARRNHRGDECEHCGEADTLHLHHIIPVMSGGTNEPWNLMTLCEQCHGSVEWFTREFAEPVLVDS